MSSPKFGAPLWTNQTSIAMSAAGIEAAGQDMLGDKPFDDPRPILALRIGITGTRQILPHQEAQIRASVAEVLRHIREKAAALAKDPAALAVYKSPASGAPPVALHIVSPLAEGADRLFAEEGLALDYALVSPLPFKQADYEQDFPDTAEAFRALLAKSLVIEIDGARGAEETASYEAVGRFVVQNCDLLIAVWDGHATGKRGGTAEITRFAAETGAPIWWIDTDPGTGARWIGDGVEWSDRLDSPSETAIQSLDAYLSRIILPPISETAEEENLIGKAAHHVRRVTDVHDDPLVFFLTEKERLPGHLIAWPWRIFSMAYARIAPRQPSKAPQKVPPPAPLEGHWDVLFQRADRLSIDYADRYRSSYLLIIFLAFFVDFVSKAGTAVSESATLPATAIELVLLLLIAGLAVFNHVGAWHERWINYRLLAELCRGQSILSPLGEKLPRPEVSRGAANAKATSSTVFSREVWVAWFVEAVSRAAPWPERDIAGSKRRAVNLGLNLAISQANYHETRSARSEVADRRLGKFGEFCFFATVVAIALRLVLLSSFDNLHYLSELSESMATSLSAASAAFIAIRFYSEFGLLDRQSQRMQRNMKDAERELAALDLNEPLSSVELAKGLQGLSMSMLLDIGGWAELFRIRAVEAG